MANIKDYLIKYNIHPENLGLSKFMLEDKDKIINNIMDINYCDYGILNEEGQLKAARKSYSAIKWFKNPSEKVKLQCVKYYPESLEFIKNPSIDVIKTAILKRPSLIKYIENQTEEMQIMAIKSCRKNGLPMIELSDLKNPSENVLKLLIIDDPYYIEELENPSEYLQMLAVITENKKNIKDNKYKLFNNITYDKAIEYVINLYLMNNALE